MQYIEIHSFISKPLSTHYGTNKCNLTTTTNHLPQQFLLTHNSCTFSAPLTATTITVPCTELTTVFRLSIGGCEQVV